MNVAIFIGTYIFLILSIIGIGTFFISLFNLNIKHNASFNNLGYHGIYGIFFLVYISLILNLISPISIYLNTFVILFGFFYTIKKLLYEKKLIFFNKILFLSIAISIFGIFYWKNHDDFPYYHLAFIDNLTLNKLEFGLGNLDIAFNHFSSIFFLSAVLKTLFTKDYFYFVVPMSVLVFCNSILLSNLFNKEKPDLSKYLYLFAFIFINTFFPKIGDHGTDKSAQILIFILIINLFYMFRFKAENRFILELQIILLTLIISFKSFYFLYAIFFLIIFFRYYKFDEILFFFKNYNICFFVILIFTLILFYNFAYSGCFIYPIPFTCKFNVFWSYGYENAKSAMIWYEQWSKGGAGPNFRVNNPTDYIQGLNWVKNWIDVYFFKKVSETLIGIFSIIMIVLLYFYPKKISFKSKFNNYKIYFILIILFTIWFFKNPALRYGGGYVLLSLIFFVPIAIILNHQQYKLNLFLKKIKTIIVIVFLIFISRNVNHVIFEIKKYNYKPLKDPHYYVNENFKRLKYIKNDIMIKTDNCSNNNISSREKLNIKCKVKSNFVFFYK